MSVFGNKCKHCGSPLPLPSGRGRPPSFCSNKKCRELYQKTLNAQYQDKFRRNKDKIKNRGKSTTYENDYSKTVEGAVVRDKCEINSIKSTTYLGNFSGLGCINGTVHEWIADFRFKPTKITCVKCKIVL